VSNRRRRQAAPGRTWRTHTLRDVRDVDTGHIDPNSAHGRVLHARELRRREPTVPELAWLGQRYDVITSPTPIVVIETEAGLRFQGLHWRGWPDNCDCGSPPCNGEAAS
jgi:hypothetical protein